MINTLPLRLTILHLAQRFRTDGETFMTKLLTNFHFVAKFLIIHVRVLFV